MPMCYTVTQRKDERTSTRADVPRRRAAPQGTVTAVQRTAVGPLDAVLDTSANASRHAAISRNPSSRNLLQSEPVAARSQKTRFDNAATTFQAARRVATFSHLRPMTCAVDEQVPETPAPLRGRRQIEPPRLSHTPRQPKPGRRVFEPKPTSAPDAFKKGTHEGAAPDRSTPNLLKFSPRAGTAARREAMLAQAMLRKQQSSGMRGVLTWSTTPRAAVVRPRTAPAAPAPYDASQPQKLSSTTTSSFRVPPAATSTSTIAAGTGPVRRVRGTHQVATRPRTARGLLVWSTN